MRGRADEIELRGILRIRRFEAHVHSTHRDIQSVARLHAVLAAIYHDAAGAADVDDAELAAREKRVGPRFFDGLERERAAHGHGATHHEALHMAVDELHFVA